MGDSSNAYVILKVGDDQEIIPFYPMSGVILPHEIIRLEAKWEPFIGYVRRASQDGSPLALFFSTHESFPPPVDVGSLVIVEEVEELENEGRLIATVKAARRIELRGNLISIRREGGTDHMMEATFIEDQTREVKPELREQVIGLLGERLGPEGQEMVKLIRENQDRELDEGLSFFIMGNLVSSFTEEGNAMRYEFLRKRSEHGRFRILRSYLEVNQPVHGEV